MIIAKYLFAYVIIGFITLEGYADDNNFKGFNPIYDWDSHSGSSFSNNIGPMGGTLFCPATLNTWIWYERLRLKAWGNGFTLPIQVPFESDGTGSLDDGNTPRD